jgi:anti-sigma factor RsiW
MIRPIIPEESMLPIHAYLDGELDPTNALAVEERIAIDPTFAAECERIETLRRLTREHVPREAPPTRLRMRVENAVGIRGPHKLFAQRQFSWRALAASVAVTAVVASGATSMLLAPSQMEPVRDGIINAHIRSLMALQPIDVASSDRHTVKPWFNGRIPQAPRVVDLAGQDFPLVGGRVDVVGEIPVPTLVYSHRKHIISLTAVPMAGRANSAPLLRAVGGYNMYHWVEDGVAYWAVSDVVAADLDKFSELFRTTPPDQK